MAESNKIQNEGSPYVHEDAAKAKASRFAWAKTRPVKIGAGIAAGALVLGATFAVGATMGKNIGPGPEGQLGNHAPFDLDGDHRAPQGGLPGGHGPQGPREHDGDRDGDRDGGFQLPADPNGSTTPSTGATDDGAVNP